MRLSRPDTYPDGSISCRKLHRCAKIRTGSRQVGLGVGGVALRPSNNMRTHEQGNPAPSLFKFPMPTPSIRRKHRLHPHDSPLRIAHKTLLLGCKSFARNIPAVTRRSDWGSGFASNTPWKNRLGGIRKPARVHGRGCARACRLCAGRDQLGTLSRGRAGHVHPAKSGILFAVAIFHAHRMIP